MRARLRHPPRPPAAEPRTDEPLTRSAPLDIAIVAPSLEIGGAERVCVNLAEAFVARGLTVEFDLLHTRGALADALSPDIDVHCFRKARARQCVAGLAQRFAKTRPRAILAATPPATWVAAAAHLIAGRPGRLVLSEHCDWAGERSSPPDPTHLAFKLQMQAAYRLADARIAVSKGAAETAARIARLPADRVAVVHNPITPLPPESPPEPEILEAWDRRPGKRLIAVGNLRRVKDYPTLFRALKTVNETAPANLLVLGEGPERRALERLVKELGLDDRVALPGSVANTRAYMARADLLVLSSTGEGFANVLVEAFACGVPVVSTDCRSGPREILDDGRLGRLTPPRDSDALAHAVLTSLEQPADRDALMRRADDFSIDAAAERYLDLLLPGDAR